MKRFLCAAAAASLLGAVAQAGGMLMMPDSTSDQVFLFDSFDGSLISTNFIDLTQQAGGASTPVNAVVAGNEIWVTDQLRDNISRWSMSGAYLGQVGASGGFDNIRGMEVVGNTAYVSNSGTNNGAPGDAVVTVDITTQMITGSFAVGDNSAGDPFDVLSYNNGLLINDISGEDIEFHNLAGVWQSTFHDSDGVTGIDFAEQMAPGRQGSVLVGGFSPPAGIYEYDSNGNQINYYDVGTGVRGVWLLGNGNIIFSDGSGAHVLDPNTGGITDIVGGSGRYFEPIPEPASLSLLALGALFVIRRR